jgi:opacity protein-like surface antigen
MSDQAKRLATIIVAVILSPVPVQAQQREFDWQGWLISVRGGALLRHVAVRTSGNPFWFYQSVAGFGGGAIIGFRAPNVPVAGHDNRTYPDVGGAVGYTFQNGFITTGFDMVAQVPVRTGGDHSALQARNTILVGSLPVFSIQGRVKLGLAWSRFHIFGFAGAELENNRFRLGFYRYGPSSAESYLATQSSSMWKLAPLLGVGIDYGLTDQVIVGVEFSRKFIDGAVNLSGYPVSAKPYGTAFKGINFPPDREDFRASYRNRDDRITFKIGVKL